MLDAIISALFGGTVVGFGWFLRSHTLTEAQRRRVREIAEKEARHAVGRALIPPPPIRDDLPGDPPLPADPREAVRWIARDEAEAAIARQVACAPDAVTFYHVSSELRRLDPANPILSVINAVENIVRSPRSRAQAEELGPQAWQPSRHGQPSPGERDE